MLLSPVWKQLVWKIKWFVLRRGNLYRWLNGCCLHSEWRHSVSVWPARSRRSRARGRVLLPSWWCWGPSAVWRSPPSGWSFSEPHTHPCTGRLGLAAGSASLSKRTRKRTKGWIHTRFTDFPWTSFMCKCKHLNQLKQTLPFKFPRTKSVWHSTESIYEYSRSPCGQFTLREWVCWWCCTKRSCKSFLLACMLLSTFDLILHAPLNI